MKKISHIHTVYSAITCSICNHRCFCHVLSQAPIMTWVKFSLPIEERLHVASYEQHVRWEWRVWLYSALLTRIVCMYLWYVLSCMCHHTSSQLCLYSKEQGLRKCCTYIMLFSHLLMVKQSQIRLFFFQKSAFGYVCVIVAKYEYVLVVWYMSIFSLVHMVHSSLIQ